MHSLVCSGVMGAHRRSLAWGVLQEVSGCRGHERTGSVRVLGYGVRTHEVAGADALGCMTRQPANQLKTGLASPVWGQLPCLAAAALVCTCPAVPLQLYMRLCKEVWITATMFGFTHTHVCPSEGCYYPRTTAVLLVTGVLWLILTMCFDMVLRSFFGD